MPQLSDTQSILLAHAAQRETGSLLPLPTSITAPAAAVAKSLASLVKRGLAEERETIEPEATRRQEGDLRFGLFVTSAGRQAIGLEEQPEGKGEADSAGTPAHPAAPLTTKARQVLDLLRRDEGATLAELVAAAGWLPHTTRAALTGLRKKGHAIEKSKREDATCYRIVSAR